MVRSTLAAFELQVVSPTADAGDGYTIRAGDSLTLNASGSTDSSGLPLTYSWDINGDGVYSDAAGVNPTLTWAQLAALGLQARSTPYQIRVLVSDGYGPTHDVVSAPVPLTVLPYAAVTSITATPAATHARQQRDGHVRRADRHGELYGQELTLTRDGGNNLIDKSVAIVAVAGYDR